MAVVTQSIGSVTGRCDHSAMQPRIRLEIVPMLDDPVRLTYLLMDGWVDVLKTIVRNGGIMFCKMITDISNMTHPSTSSLSSTSSSLYSSQETILLHYYSIHNRVHLHLIKI